MATTPYLRRASDGRTWMFRARVVNSQGRAIECKRVTMSLGTDSQSEAEKHRDLLVSFLSRGGLLPSTQVGRYAKQGQETAAQAENRFPTASKSC